MKKMTRTEYFLQGQEEIYSVYTFPFKPAPFAEIFLNSEKLSTILPWVHEIFLISSLKASVNTFQSNKKSRGYLSFGKMGMNEVTSKFWLEKYYNTEGWNHFHTDFWAPQKTTAIKNYTLPEIVVCIYGDGKLRTNPNNENLYSNNFSIIINDKLLDELARKQVDGAVKKIKQQLYGCYYFHFKAPWTRCKVMISADGNASFHVDYMLANVDGAFLSGGCINYLKDCKWNNIYCDEGEIIERELLP